MLRITIEALERVLQTRGMRGGQHLVCGFSIDISSGIVIVVELVGVAAIRINRLEYQ